MIRNTRNIRNIRNINKHPNGLLLWGLSEKGIGLQEECNSAVFVFDSATDEQL